MSRLYTRGTAYVHVGTHKTGTTSIQALLGKNEDAFRTASVFVPQTGRIYPGCAGHHNIAWELLRDPRFDPAHGTFAELLLEAKTTGTPNLCLSSEEFEFIHHDDVALRRLRDGLLTIGYEPKIVLYLRPQGDYLESLYAEAVREWDIAFADFLETILEAGIYGCSRFEYGRLTGAFANVFGHEHMIVRAYRAAAPTVSLLRDFTSIVAPANLAFASLALPHRLNPMATFRDVIVARERQLGCTVHQTILPGQRFDPLTLLDIVRLTVRFWHGNDDLRRSYGVRVGCVTPGMFARELVTELFRDRESRHRKRLIRSLVETDVEVAA